MNLRPATPADTRTLVEIARHTGVFKPFELDTLGEVLDDYHATNRDSGHASSVAEVGGEVVGFHYIAPAAMTDRTWEVWWLAVDPAHHGKGYGRLLLDHAEAVARAGLARLLLIETSTTPLYKPARAFYLRQGYRHAATVPDFYADGDGKAIYMKKQLSVVSC